MKQKQEQLPTAQAWTKSEEVTTTPSGTTRIVRAITPQYIVEERVRALRADGRRTPLQHDWQEVLAGDPKLRGLYADQILAMGEIAQLGLASVRFEQLRQRTLWQSKDLNAYSARKRSVKAIPTQCIERMGIPSLNDYQGANIERSTLQRVDLERHGSRLTPLQREIMDLQSHAYTRSEIADRLGVEEHDLASEFRQIQRLNKSARRRLKTWSTPLPRSPEGSLVDLCSELPIFKERT